MIHPIKNAIYPFNIKGKNRRLLVTDIDENRVYLRDVDTWFSFYWKKERFGFMFRTALNGKVEFSNGCPYLTEADEATFRAEDVRAGESSIIPFGEEFKNSQEFEKSISFLLMAPSSISEEIKRRTSFSADELYAELQYFYDFEKSRTENKKRELLKAYSTAFNVMYAERLI